METLPFIFLPCIALPPVLLPFLSFHLAKYPGVFLYSASNIFTGLIVIIYGSFDFIFMVLINEKVVLKEHVSGTDGSAVVTP